MVRFGIVCFYEVLLFGKRVIFLISLRLGKIRLVLLPASLGREDSMANFTAPPEIAIVFNLVGNMEVQIISI